MLTLEKNIIREEYNAISDDIYTSFFTSTQLVDDYAQWLKNALIKNIFQTKEQKAHIIKFIAKLQTQRELLELSKNEEALRQTQNAAASFARKSKINTP